MNTKKGLGTALRNWETFCKEFNFNNRLDFTGSFQERRLQTIRLCNWLQWNTLRKSKTSEKKAMTSAASFLTYVYNLQAAHQRGGREWKITYEFHLMKKRLKRQYGWGGRRKLPLFISMIDKLESTGALILHIGDDTQVITIMLMTVFGLMRISEVLDLKVKNVRETQVNQTQALMLTLEDSKTMKRNRGKPEIVMLVEREGTSRWCPYKLLRDKVRSMKAANINGKIFTMPRRRYSDKLRKALSLIGFDSKLYDTHSGRIGGATMLWEKGIPMEQIKAYGRWQSDCWLWYCRRLSTDYVKLSRAIGSSTTVSSELVSQLIRVSQE